MERICAARAMEWSIELEKGLRSMKPGRPIEAILQTGPRLEQWSKEPSYPRAVLDMFGLVPGEDRLFANTILLRLADAFMSGDKHTRLCLLKVFLLELKHCRKKGKRYSGILAKQRVPNYLELLRRVKIVFDTGDVESRGLALRLLGCWADFAKDSAEVRYMILSSLGSCHVLEVKASLFAAGCFSELSEDFACIVLEMMIKMITSPKTSSTIKLAGVRTFAKMGCSSLLASRAYKAGKKLVLESSHEEFIVEMLVSLSKLASKALLLISEQVDLLLSFSLQTSASCVQATALRCLDFLLVVGVCLFPVNASVVKTLFHVLDNNNLSLGSQCETLKILCKIFRAPVPSLPCIDISEFVKLVPSVETAAQSPIRLKRFLSLRLLVDISCDHRMAMEMIPGANGPIPFSSWVILLLIDQIEGLAKLVVKPCGTASEMKRDYQNLLNLIITMVEKYPTLGVLALDKIRLSIQSMFNFCIGDSDTRTAVSSSVHEIVGLDGERHALVASKLVFCMYKVLESCIETLDEASAITPQVHQLRLLVNVIHQSSLFNQDIYTIYLFLLHSCVMLSYLGNENNEACNVAKELGISHNDYWVEQERLMLEYMKKIMAGKDNWAAYRAGKWAACQGAWFATAFMSGQLINRVQSDSCHYWLKSLALFAQAESTVLLLLFPQRVNDIWIAPCRVALGELGRGSAWNADSQNCIERLTEAYTGVYSAGKMLASAITFNQTFYFQRWFLGLRAKVLETAVDILRFLSSNTCTNGNIYDTTWVEGTTEVGPLGPAQDFHLLAYFLTRFSFGLNRLVREFDLLATSFMVMDSESFRTISRLAVNCSLLAFCTGFILYYPNLYEKSMLCGLENMMKCSHLTLLKDVIERLWHIDGETSTNLKVLLTFIEEPKTCFHLQPRTLLYRAGVRERETLVVSRFAVSEVLHLQEKAKGMNDEEVLCQVSRTGVQLLSNILKKWLKISFQTPKYFFQVRPCVGAELFAFSGDTRKSDELSILPGFHISLNLCLQMKNTSPVLPEKITKLYCILACSPSYQTPGLDGESKEQTQSGFRAWESDDAVDLNEKLTLYVMEGMKRTSRKHGRTCGDGGGLVWSCVGFESNEKGQGFSTCLLDVSAFPLGSYKIKWHSCCIDSRGSYWSLLPLNAGPRFTVKKPPVNG
ncbi:hypothetical protein BVC80_9101g272 [Macleaya cordata]|uniref:Integrator complex subunit 7 n=1 Tax=Macleaya cordata TaxID=56857 RepID=A0A200QGV6_MACCD|nr:hypothetical protein BVC80_9101g272 [Macleaya cordata]